MCKILVNKENKDYLEGNETIFFLFDEVIMNTDFYDTKNDSILKYIKYDNLIDCLERTLTNYLKLRHYVFITIRKEVNYNLVQMLNSFFEDSNLMVFYILVKNKDTVFTNNKSFEYDNCIIEIDTVTEKRIRKYDSVNHYIASTYIEPIDVFLNMSVSDNDYLAFFNVKKAKICLFEDAQSINKAEKEILNGYHNAMIILDKNENVFTANDIINKIVSLSNRPISYISIDNPHTIKKECMVLYS